MASRLRITFPGAFYHMASRGNARKAVFKGKRDRQRLLEWRRVCSCKGSKHLVVVNIQAKDSGQSAINLGSGMRLYLKCARDPKAQLKMTEN
jgi:hypothetical protein